LADRGLLNLRWAAVLAWAAFVVVLSVLPGRAMPGIAIPGLDKIAHFVFYSALALLAERAARKPHFTSWAVVTVSCGLLGAMLELVQRFLPGRSMSVADMLVNFLGAAVGSATYILWVRTRATT
jgi:VanZ family protein